MPFCKCAVSIRCSEMDSIIYLTTVCKTDIIYRQAPVGWSNQLSQYGRLVSKFNFDLCPYLHLFALFPSRHSTVHVCIYHLNYWALHHPKARVTHKNLEVSPGSFTLLTTTQQASHSSVGWSVQPVLGRLGVKFRWVTRKFYFWSI